MKTDVVRKRSHYLYENVYGLQYDIYMFIVQSAWSKCIHKRLNVSVFVFDLKNGGLVCYEVLC
jgi:hypothetical protein